RRAAPSYLPPRPPRRSQIQECRANRHRLWSSLCERKYPFARTRTSPASAPETSNRTRCHDTPCPSLRRHRNVPRPKTNRYAARNASRFASPGKPCRKRLDPPFLSPSDISDQGAFGKVYLVKQSEK